MSELFEISEGWLMFGMWLFPVALAGVLIAYSKKRNLFMPAITPEEIAQTLRTNKDTKTTSTPTASATSTCVDVTTDSSCDGGSC